MNSVFMSLTTERVSVAFKPVRDIQMVQKNDLGL